MVLIEASEVGLLGGKVRCFQPTTGYRSAIDPVLLAASVGGEAGQSVLEVGIGAGAAALCLAARVDGVCIMGLEQQPEMAALAMRGIKASGLAARVEVVIGDLLEPPANLAPGSFDHVFANPPYGEAGRVNVPLSPTKAASTVEGPARLVDWLAFCGRMVRDGGSVTIIHRAERVGEILSLMGAFLGGLVVFPLWPSETPPKPAKRVLVQGRKGVKTPLTMAPGLVLSAADGGYTRKAEAVLRHGAAIVLTASDA